MFTTLYAHINQVQTCIIKSKYSIQRWIHSWVEILDHGIIYHNSIIYVVFVTQCVFILIAPVMEWPDRIPCGLHPCRSNDHRLERDPRCNPATTTYGVKIQWHNLTICKKSSILSDITNLIWKLCFFLKVDRWSSDFQHH